MGPIFLFLVHLGKVSQPFNLHTNSVSPRNNQNIPLNLVDHYGRYKIRLGPF